MTRAHTLRLLLAAECHDLASIEATLRAITERIDELEPEGSDYVLAHRRLDELLAQRALLVAPGAG